MTPAEHALQNTLTIQVARMWQILAVHGVIPQMLPLRVTLGDTGTMLGLLRGTRRGDNGVGHIVVSDRLPEQLQQEGLGLHLLGKVVQDTLLHEAVHQMLRVSEEEDWQDFREAFFGVPWDEDPASGSDRDFGDGHGDPEEERVSECLAMHLSGQNVRAHPWPETLLSLFVSEWKDAQVELD